VTTTIAMDAQEPMGEYPALEIRAQLSLDEVRDGLTPLASFCEKRLELFADDSMEQRSLRLAAFVLGHANPVRASSTAHLPRRLLASIGHFIEERLGREGLATK